MGGIACARAQVVNDAAAIHREELPRIRKYCELSQKLQSKCVKEWQWNLLQGTNVALS